MAKKKLVYSAVKVLYINSNSISKATAKYMRKKAIPEFISSKPGSSAIYDLFEMEEQITYSEIAEPSAKVSREMMKLMKLCKSEGATYIILQ